MTEPESKPPVAAAPPRPPRRRLRLFLILAVSAVFIGIVGPIAFYLWASSDATQAVVRRRIIAVLEESTGGRVEIAAFHWHLLNLEADLDGLVLHGREAAGEAPCARVDHASVKLSILGFFSPRILLRSLEIEHPAFHLIVYPDGSTNLPQPRKPRKPGKGSLRHISPVTGTMRRSCNHNIPLSSTRDSSFKPCRTWPIFS